MMYNNWGNMMSFGGSWGWGMWFVPLIVWAIVWKAWALWIAARRGEKIWFGVMMVVNTVGILEILYIFVFSKMKHGECCKGACCTSECCSKDKPVVEAPKVETKPEVKQP